MQLLCFPFDMLIKRSHCTKRLDLHNSNATPKRAKPLFFIRISLFTELVCFHLTKTCFSILMVRQPFTSYIVTNKNCFQFLFSVGKKLKIVLPGWVFQVFSFDGCPLSFRQINCLLKVVATSLTCHFACNLLVIE